MDQLNAMKLFTRVVETGSFSAVAREMNMGQPAVSKQVSALEQKVGARLLNRSSRQLVLTEAGSGYYERCLGILADVEEAESLASTLTETPRGRLRVNMSVAFGRLRIAPFVPEFLERYPEITLELLMDNRYVDLVAERVDVAFQRLLVAGLEGQRAAEERGGERNAHRREQRAGPVVEQALDCPGDDHPEPVQHASTPARGRRPPASGPASPRRSIPAPRHRGPKCPSGR